MASTGIMMGLGGCGLLLFNPYLDKFVSTLLEHQRQQRATHLHLARVQPLPLGRLHHRLHDHVEIVLVAHGDHVPVRVVVLDLDLEPPAEAKLGLDAADQIGELDRHADHDVPHVAGVHLDADLGRSPPRGTPPRRARHGSWGSAVGDHLKVALVERGVLVVAALFLLFNVPPLASAVALLCLARPRAPAVAAPSSLVHVVQIGVRVVVLLFDPASWSLPLRVASCWRGRCGARWAARELIRRVPLVAVVRSRAVQVELARDRFGAAIPHRHPSAHLRWLLVVLGRRGRWEDVAAVGGF